MKDDAPERIYYNHEYGLQHAGKIEHQPFALDMPCAEYRRADLPPTLAEAMTVPEVETMAGLLEMMDAAIENSVSNLSGDLVFRMAEGWHSVASLRTSIRATLARLKGDTL